MEEEREERRKEESEGKRNRRRLGRKQGERMQVWNGKEEVTGKRGEGEKDAEKKKKRGREREKEKAGGLSQREEKNKGVRAKEIGQEEGR